jgi:PEP-CTERM motif
MNSPSPLSRLSGAFGRAKTFLKLSLILTALVLPGVAPAGNLTGRYATITLDGSLSDWQPGDVMYSASEIGAGAPLASTFSSVSVANDSSYLYVAFQHPAPTTINDPWTYNLYLDTDMTLTTGFNGGWMTAGYDRLVQYGASGGSYSTFSFTGATQPTWGWNWLGLISYSYSDLVTEWAIPISTLGMTGDQMRMEFNTTGTGVTTETWAYQWESGAGAYTIATVPEPGSLSLLALGALFLGVRARQRRQHSNGAR